MQEVKGSHYQYSNDKENWKDYNLGDDKKIDKLFEMHQFYRDQCRIRMRWITNFIPNPHFLIKNITTIYRANIFNLAAILAQVQAKSPFQIIILGN